MGWLPCNVSLRNTLLLCKESQYKLNLYRIIQKTKNNNVAYLFFYVRQRSPNRKYSRCLTATCWVLYHMNSWQFLLTIWSLDSGVNILINLDCKCLEPQTCIASDFVFDRYWNSKVPKVWKLSLLPACRDPLCVSSHSYLHLKWLWARCLCFMALLDWKIWSKMLLFSVNNEWCNS